MITQEEFHGFVIKLGMERIISLQESNISWKKTICLETNLVTLEFESEWCGYSYKGRLQYQNVEPALNHEAEYAAKQRIFNQMINELAQELIRSLNESQFQSTDRTSQKRKAKSSRKNLEKLKKRFLKS